MEETPQPRTIQLNQKGRPRSWIAETSEPNQWELHWNAEIAQIVKWILRNAERAALRNDGESLVVTAGPEENVIVKAVLDYTQYMEVQQEDDRYVINLLSPSSDGLVHDDDDDRTPLRHITCTTCVYRFTQSRQRKRDQVMEQRLGPAATAVETRRVAEAWLRLAETEELLAENWDETTRKRPIRRNRVRNNLSEGNQSADRSNQG